MPDAPKGATKTSPVNPGELALPKKTQELVDRLDRSNLNVTEKLQKGENPFAGTLPFMRIVAHLLIKLDRPLTRQFVAAAFMTKFDWQQNTADAHARMAFQALEHIGAVREMNGTIQIKRT
ncbi:hypothetical protein [Phyllobacterium myrsinacearum]|uniref:Uncharacterized protein n=1 Tax=Phyllobacterium myrsinacearum TaxID=28101 RepID=A0A839ENW2_9HYPH|nr:hypothetical protein [Phyllobacterium myrsinacearum]MBA8881771.1 hypothetical protein [Phyllobacterium myrsinacearum]